jgi:parvulin-like peptidyl-prolyl isomerase
MAVRVNGSLIDDADIEREAERLRPHYLRYVAQTGARLSDEEQSAQLLEWAEENLVETVLLRQAEREDPVDLPDSDVEAAMRDLEASYGGREKLEQSMAAAPDNLERLRRDVVDGMRTQRFVERLTRDLRPVPGEEVERFYRANPEQFRTPEVIHARHIVKNAVDAPDEASMLEPLREAKRELDGGADFGDVADRFSDCPGDGGDLGWFPRGRMVESFETVVRRLQPGETSEIFPTEFGYHIAQLLDLRPAGTAPLEEVREGIAGRLLEERKRTEVERFVDELKERAVIERLEASPGKTPSV